MDYHVNKGKELEIDLKGDTYIRHSIVTHFVKPEENYLDIIKTYVKPIYQKGDIISISEKIISLCQNKIIKRADIHVGFFAKFLSHFASHPETGVGVGESIKMQYAINKVGILKVLWASMCSAIGKLFGKKGIFYQIVGQEVSGLDGFYDHVWKEYGDIGIELPENPFQVCKEIEEELGILCMIVDANDLGQEILGYSPNVSYSPVELIALIRDNPAGQGQETTPLVLIRKK